MKIFFYVKIFLPISNNAKNIHINENYIKLLMGLPQNLIKGRDAFVGDNK